jgi:hypothetical protein
LILRKSNLSTDFLTRMSLDTIKLWYYFNVTNDMFRFMFEGLELLRLIFRGNVINIDLLGNKRNGGIKIQHPAFEMFWNFFNKKSPSRINREGL